jgi:SOS response regulatory protein OraA/RecX
MATKYAVVRVAGVQPEAFVEVGVNLEEGAMKSMSERMSEKEMRKHLAGRGATQQEVDEAIDTAKKEPPR